MSDVRYDIAALLDKHGTLDVLTAIRDACINASDFTAIAWAEVDASASWEMAAEGAEELRRRAVEAEAESSFNLADSLLVLDDTTTD